MPPLHRANRELRLSSAGEISPRGLATQGATLQKLPPMIRLNDQAGGRVSYQASSSPAKEGDGRENTDSV